MKNQLKPNAQRAKIAAIVIAIVLFTDVLNLASSLMQYELLDRIATGENFTQAEANANDLRETAVGILSVVMILISAITFIMWFRRAYYNLHQKINYLKYDEGWAAGCWFVPFVNLVRPFQIMQELFNETIAYLKKMKQEIPFDTNTALLGFWWTFWIIDNIIGQVIFRYARNAETLDQMTTLTVGYIVESSLSIICALIIIKIIKDYSKLETLLYEVNDEDIELAA